MRLSVGVAQAFATAAGGDGGMTDARARKLLRAAVYFMNQHQRRLGKPAPAVKRRGKVRYTGASAPGEYPRKRTGFLQANVWMDAWSPSEVVSYGKIRVGLKSNAFYGAVLEVKYRRKGLRDTLSDLLPQLRALAGEGLRYEVLDNFVDT